MRTAHHRGPAPLLPTHGFQDRYRAPKKRGNAIMRVMVITVIIAACAYGGFAWVVLGRKGQAAEGQEQAPKAKQRVEYQIGNTHMQRRRQQQQQQQQQKQHAPVHVRSTLKRTDAKRHGSALHEASGDLHHPSNNNHQIQDNQHMHEMATSGQGHADAISNQYAADLQHQADIKQQEELTNTHAPETSPPPAHVTDLQAEQAAPVQTQDPHATQLHQQDTHAADNHVEVEQILPSHGGVQQAANAQAPQQQHGTHGSDTNVHAPIQQPDNHHQQQQQATHTQETHATTEAIHAPATTTTNTPMPLSQETHAPVAHATTMPTQQQQGSGEAHAPDTAKLREAHGLYGLSARDIDGVEQSLSQYAGNVTIVVNVASACGYTDENYKGLKALYDKYHPHGLEILAFPCNQFGSQEPGTEPEIKQFCSSHFHTSFPLFSKIEVNGPNTHPVFQFLKSHAPAEDGGGGGIGPGDDIGWNFFKFLVDKTGKPIKRWTQRWNQIAVEREVYAALLHS